uniref:DDE-1 domain-containing protein n=1 Tax=Iconisemion striatum TaxID=60296 RepID=A0A1A7X477_9TELE
MVPPNTVDVRGMKSIVLKNTGHEKSHRTVVLAAKADGTKLKPFIVFRGAIREVKAMQQEISRAVIATSANGWMNDDLTKAWLRSVGKFSFRLCLLVWDAYRCHISSSTKQELRPYNITTAVITGGYTKDRPGRQALTAVRQRKNENRRATKHEEDEEELHNNELVVEAGTSDEEITGRDEEEETGGN